MKYIKHYEKLNEFNPIGADKSSWSKYSKELLEVQSKIESIIINKKITANSSTLGHKIESRVSTKGISFIPKECKLVFINGDLLLFVYVPKDSIEGKISGSLPGYSEEFLYYMIMTSWLHFKYVSEIESDINVLVYNKPCDDAIKDWKINNNLKT